MRDVDAQSRKQSLVKRVWEKWVSLGDDLQDEDSTSSTIICRACARAGRIGWTGIRSLSFPCVSVPSGSFDLWPRRRSSEGFCTGPFPLRLRMTYRVDEGPTEA
jgi:hypothetical protein